MSRLDDLKDIITLSKEANITLSEAIALFREYNKASSDDSEPAPEKKVPEKTEEQSDGNEQPDKALQNEHQTESNDKVIDYKSKYEEMERKLEKLQQDNAAKDISGNENKKNDIEIVNDITRSFM